MAFSKAHRFDPRDTHYSLVCKAVSHPARLAVLRQLYEHGPCSFKDLKKGKPISQPTMSQHMEILRKMQIVKYEEPYPNVIYWLNIDLPETYDTVVQLITQAGQKFDQHHGTELMEISQAYKTFVNGI